MMQRENVCADAPLEECTQAAATAQIQTLGTANGSNIALVSFKHDDAICGNVNCPFLVVAFQKNDARKILWTDGYAASVGSESPLPSIRVTSHDSEDTGYISYYDWRNNTYVRTQYLRERLATGETRPASLPIDLQGRSSTTVHGTVSHYWNVNFDVAAQGGQQITVSEVKSSAPLLIMLNGPDGLPVAAKVVAGTSYPLPNTGAYQLSVYLDSAEGPDRDQPFQFTVTIR